MPVFDASSIIHAWDNYPVQQFPGLWEWMASQIEVNSISISSVAFNEVGHKTPDCGRWLDLSNIERLSINNEIMQDAMRIKGLLGIIGDQFDVKGVDENDLLILSTARHHGLELISEERQPNPPVNPKKRKIPVVCRMPEVAVPCLTFIEFIRQSNEVFR
jgi:predicted nucleic acid-binding protein